MFAMNLVSLFSHNLLLFILNLITIPTIIWSESLSDPSLRLLFMVHRHGDRTPIQCYPTDPYANASHWADGWGQLTPRGKQRMYSLGQYIRSRYQHFLGSSPREVHIRSSGADRCLESAALVMAGMYRPEDRWQWNQDLGKQWQPFPIQTEPRSCDGMLNSGSKCLVAEQEMKRIYNSPEVRQYTEQRKSILEYVSINTRLNVTDLNSAEEVFDTLLIEKENKLTLPRWVDSHTYQSLSQIADMTFYFDFSTKLIQRLRTGLLLNDIILRMKESIETNKSNSSLKSDSNKKLYIYSTHDTQIALLLNALNVFDQKSPPFGSTVLIELRQRVNEYIIQMYYLKDTESEDPIPLHLPNCTNTRNECLFAQFNQSVADLIPDDWDYECHNKELTYEYNTVMSYLFGSLLTLSVLTLIYIFYILLKPKNRGIVYQMLPIR